LAVFAWLLAGVGLAAPNVTASKDDNLAAGLRKLPGNTITYITAITNTGVASAFGVQTSDPDPLNATFVSVFSTPIARNDTYSAIGIVQITIPVGSSVLVNDNAADGVGPALIVSASPATASGNLSASNNGSFTCNPAPGFMGADTLNYLISVTGTAPFNGGGHSIHGIVLRFPLSLKGCQDPNVF
jgi:uncharacterized repeat protein (TIGR01451 family)